MLQQRAKFSMLFSNLYGPFSWILLFVEQSTFDTLYVSRYIIAHEVYIGCFAILVTLIFPWYRLPSSTSFLMLDKCPFCCSCSR